MMRREAEVGDKVGRIRGGKEIVHDLGMGSVGLGSKDVGIDEVTEEMYGVREGDHIAETTAGGTSEVGKREWLILRDAVTVLDMRGGSLDVGMSVEP